VPASGQARWGWHHLSPRWADQIVADAQVSPGDLVVDIGAGTGALTASLVAAGARVVAVELHPQRLAVLRERFADAPVTVVRADATYLRLPRRPFRVVAHPAVRRHHRDPAAPTGSRLAPGRRGPRAPAVGGTAVGVGQGPGCPPLGP
jgi:2-polyprenyl-3-methyl-5-hydroxy-6-metoxy-1,4-benzoquinol methylase